MACQPCLRWSSFILLTLALASWVITLGALGAINWMVCTDTQATRTDIAATQGGTEAAGLYAKLSVPPVNTDVAVCARSWRWEWWTLFFELAVISYGLASTLLPARMTRARYSISQYLVVACVLIMIAINDNIVDLWVFWDAHRLFDEYRGVMQRLYYSVAALVAGWILTVIFNLAWIGCILDQDVEEKRAPASDVEAAAAARK